MSEPRLPDPALVVLVGASGSGKSTWAERRYRAAEIVSSDALRGLVGSGRHDLDASAEAFALLDQILAGRVRRGLTTVVDTLGLDQARRLAYLDLGRRTGSRSWPSPSTPTRRCAGSATPAVTVRCLLRC